MYKRYWGSSIFFTFFHLYPLEFVSTFRPAVFSKISAIGFIRFSVDRGELDSLWFESYTSHLVLSLKFSIGTFGKGFVSEDIQQQNVDSALELNSSVVQTSYWVNIELIRIAKIKSICLYMLL